MFGLYGETDSVSTDFRTANEESGHWPLSNNKAIYKPRIIDLCRQNQDY